MNELYAQVYLLFVHCRGFHEKLILVKLQHASNKGNARQKYSSVFFCNTDGY